MFQEPVFLIFLCAVFVAVVLLVWNLVTMLQSQTTGQGMTVVGTTIDPIVWK